MKYVEFKEYGELFAFSNQIAQQMNFDHIFGEIHRLSDLEFQELYVSRDTENIEDIELLADITKINIAAWKKFSGTYGNKIDLLKEIKEDFEGGRYTVLQIMAPVGAGKTTFIHYFLRVQLPGMLKSILDVVPIVFDFREEEVTNENMSSILYKFINSQIEKCFGCFGDPSKTEDFFNKTHKIDLEIMADELNRKGFGAINYPLNTAKYIKQREIIDDEMRKNPILYLNKKLRYVREKYPKTKMLLALDNIDQFASLNPGIAVSILNQIASRLKIDSLITLRDTTYRLFQGFDPAGDWHRPKIIIITPTNIGKIGVKRLKYLNEKIKYLLGEESIYYKFLRHILYQFETISKRRKSFSFSILWDWLDNLGNHNMREILDLLRYAMRSYHLTEEEFVKTRTCQYLKYDGQSDINIKRFKTAFIDGIRPYFHEEQSGTEIVNLFNEGNHKFIYHYIFRLKILQWLDKFEIFTIRGQINKLKNIIGDEYQGHIKNTLNIFVKKGLILIELFSENRSYKTLNGKDVVIDDPRVFDSKAFVSPNGKYHLNTLIYDDIYLDEMKFSTDHSLDIFKEIFRNQSQEISTYRKHSTNRFISVLIKEEENHVDLCKNLDVENICGEIKKKYEEDKKLEDYFHSISRSRTGVSP